MCVSVCVYIYIYIYIYTIIIIIIIIIISIISLLLLFLLLVVVVSSLLSLVLSSSFLLSSSSSFLLSLQSSTKATKHNWLMLGLNAFFCSIHLLQTHLTYDGLAQEVSYTCPEAGDSHAFSAPHSVRLL